MSQLLHSKLHNLNIVLNLFFFSDHLEPCYECWKVKKKMGTVGSICQFEGFRKVRRIAAGQSKLFEFETVGFMDPYRGKYFAERGRLCLGHFLGAPGQNSWFLVERP